jgi:pyruvate ferredoxin oxidoreductase beta subunit
MAEMSEDLIAPGHSACAGCGEILAVKHILRAVGKNSVICCATGCMEITTTPYPKSAWRLPWLHVTFENAAAVASGVKAALDKQGKKDVNVVALGGDGAMFDIGFQAMSGAMERGHDILIICTDNEAYMNTGIQRSSATPLFAATTTSPAGKVIPGKRQWKKPMVEICAAHGIPYAASASIANIPDLQAKIKKALTFKGPKFIHVHSPCPVGWRFGSSLTMDVARLAVDTGMWVLYEIVDGEYRITHKPQEFKPIAEYLRLQGRFKHVDEQRAAKLQELVRKNYQRLLSKEKSVPPVPQQPPRPPTPSVSFS